MFKLSFGCVSRSVVRSLLTCIFWLLEQWNQRLLPSVYTVVPRARVSIRDAQCAVPSRGRGKSCVFAMRAGIDVRAIVRVRNGTTSYETVATLAALWRRGTHHGTTPMAMPSSKTFRGCLAADHLTEFTTPARHGGHAGSQLEETSPRACCSRVVRVVS